MDINELKNVLRRYNLSPNFTYGQNFLINETVLEDMLEAAQVGDSDCVLEIGPGIGNLTRSLCKRAKFVLSIEKDPKFFPILKSIKKDHKNFRFEIADALEFNFQDFFKAEGCASYKVVANIPYYVTGKILQTLLTAPFRPESITVLVQKEVARNTVASPGDLSILAISVQLFGDAKIIRTVPAESFYPAPKVDSAVLHIQLHKKPKYVVQDQKKFFALLKACFSGKRKQLHNTLANNLHLEKSFVEKVLAELKISPQVRPQELSIEEWIELNSKLQIPNIKSMPNL